MTTSNNMPETVGKRLREFAEKRYGSQYKLAQMLEMMPQSLSQYISGRRLPGNKLQAKLRAIGCDIEWLMTGRTERIAEGLKSDVAISFYPDGISEKEKMLYIKLAERLRNYGPKDIHKIERILDAALEEPKPKKKSK